MSQHLTTRGESFVYADFTAIVGDFLSNKYYRKITKLWGSPQWEASPDFTLGQLLRVIPELEEKVIKLIQMYCIKTEEGKVLYI